MNFRTFALPIAAAGLLIATTAAVVPSAAATIVTPEQFGAVGDGVHNDTAALQAAFNAGGTVRITRVYAHTDVVHVSAADTVLTGGGTLLGTVPATSSVWIEGSNVNVGAIHIAVENVTQRLGSYESYGVRLVGTTGTIMTNTTITGSAAAGVYIGNGSTGFNLTAVTVRDTYADGFHITQGSGNGTLTNTQSIDTGDDGVAVVSYAQDGAPVHDVTITHPIVDGAAARGVSVVGGTNITYKTIDVANTAAAAVYVASEDAPYNTTAPLNTIVSGGTVTNANTNPNIDHGSLLVVSGAASANTVTISNLVVRNGRATASRDLGVITGSGTPPTKIKFTAITITGGPNSAYQGNAPAASFTLTNVTKNGAVVTP